MKTDMVVVTHNNATEAIYCISGIVDSSLNTRIIWVDNGSDWECRNAIMKSLMGKIDYQCLWLAKTRKDIARKYGIRFSNEVLKDSRYVGNCNVDIAVADGWIDRMVGILDNNPSISGIGPVIGNSKNWQNPQKIGSVAKIFKMPSGFVDSGRDEKSAKLDYSYGMMFRPCKKKLSTGCFVKRKDAMIDSVKEAVSLGSYVEVVR